jgi:hypothetical protein
MACDKQEELLNKEREAWAAYERLKTRRRKQLPRHGRSGASLSQVVKHILHIVVVSMARIRICRTAIPMARGGNLCGA